MSFIPKLHEVLAHEPEKAEGIGYSDHLKQPQQI